MQRFLLRNFLVADSSKEGGAAACMPRRIGCALQGVGFGWGCRATGNVLDTCQPETVYAGGRGGHHRPYAASAQNLRLSLPDASYRGVARPPRQIDMRGH